MLDSSKEENKKEKNIQIVMSKETKKSTPNKLKGVDTMKKNCYHRKDGRWQYSKQENGMLYYTIANTYRELLEKIKTIKPRQLKITKKVKSKTLTFNQYFNYYIENYIKTKDLKPNTIKSWIDIFKNHILPYFNKISIDKVNTEMIQQFLATIKKERTQEIIYQRIVKVLNKAYITGAIKKNITLGIEKPKRKNIIERPPLTYDQQVALIDKIKGTNIYAFIMFSIIVGSRAEETAQFNLLSDVNTSKSTITIHSVKTVKNKTREVQVTEEFIQFLKNNMKNNTFEHKAQYYSTKLAGIYKELNIKNCLHGLRHTCASNLYFLGANDKYRQLQLGHKSIVTTNDIYTNIIENIPKAKLRSLYGNLYPSFD